MRLLKPYLICCLLLSMAGYICAADIEAKRIPELRELLKGSDRVLFKGGCSELELYQGPQMLKFIDELLGHKRWLVRNVAVRCLELQGLEQFDKYLNTLFQRRDPLLKAAVFGLYCERNPDSALKTFSQVLSKKTDAAVRLAAARAARPLIESEYEKSHLKRRNEIIGKLLLDESPHVQAALIQSMLDSKAIDRGLVNALLRVIFKTPYEETAITIGALLQDCIDDDDLKWLRKETKRAKGQACVNGILAQLSYGSPYLVDEISSYMKNRDPLVQAAAIEAVRDVQEQFDDKQAKTIQKMLFSALRAKSDTVRICAAVVLASQGNQTLVGEMVSGHKKDRTGIYNYLLQEMTGQELTKTSDWNQWYRNNKKGLQVKPFNTDKEGRDPHYFYDIQDNAKHVVYVIDTSGSMGEGGRLWRVKQELLKSVWHLALDARFNVVTFNSNCHIWQKSSLRASWRNRMRWYEYSQSIPPQGATNIMGAMDLALNVPEVESIYFLTDGMPTVGLTNPQAIIDLVSELNFDKQYSARIHAVSFNLPQARDFLTVMSQRNRGQFKLVAGND